MNRLRDFQSSTMLACGAWAALVLGMLLTLSGCAGEGSDVCACGQPASRTAELSHAIDRAPGTTPRAQAPEGDAYYLSTCPLCGTLLGAAGDAQEFTHAERHLRVCSPKCAQEFHTDPVGGLTRIDAVLIADQLPHYPLKTSLFDDHALPSQPMDFVWGNRLFRLADARERDRVLADPDAAFKRLDRAVIKAQRETYGMPNKCPVQGDILPNEQRIDIVVANRMIRVCCGRCVRVVKARPYQYLAMVEYANREADARRAEEREP